MTSQRKKKPFFGYKKTEFFKVKNRTFPKGLTRGFGQFVYVDLVK